MRTTAQVVPALVTAALEARDELVPSARESLLLHGNFRQGKVLAADRTPWLAVGPEPLVGERAYDLARLVRDRVEDLIAASSGASAARRRVNKLADSLEVDPDRLRGWTLFRAVESASRALSSGRQPGGGTGPGVRWLAVAGPARPPLEDIAEGRCGARERGAPARAPHPSRGAQPRRRATASPTVISSRSPVRRSFSSTTPSAARRPATRIFGTPISSASVNFTPGETPGRSSTRTRRPAAAELVRDVEGQLRLEGLARGDHVDVGRGDLLGPAQALLVRRLLRERRDRTRDTDAVRAHRHPHGLAVLAEHVELEGVGVLAAELEDVADLDGAVELEARAALGAGVALLDHDDVEVVVDLEVAARDDVLRVLAVLVGAGDPGGAGRDARVGDVADLLQALRADVAADQVGAAGEVLGGDQFDGRRARGASPSLPRSTSRSPGTPTATISPSTLTRRFFRVAEAGTPRCAASVSMVGVSGVSSSSTGPCVGAVDRREREGHGLGVGGVVAEGQSTKVSSPAAAGARNSSDAEPPIAPETAEHDAVVEARAARRS